MTTPPLKRSEIAKILKRHHGSKAELARRAGVGHTAISHWLKGRSKSAPVAQLAEILCRELLDREAGITQETRIEDGPPVPPEDVNGPSVRKILPIIRPDKDDK